MAWTALWQKRSIFFLHLIALFCFHQYGYIGHYGFDDMQYAELANNLLKGQIDFEDHFSYRITIVLFTAISYAFFGINDFASSLPSLIMTSLILWIIFQVLKRKETYQLSIGLSLCLFTEWFLSYSGKLMPDIYLASFCTLALYQYWRFKFSSVPAFKASALMAISLFLAFNSKGTIVLLIPVLILFFLFDFKHKPHRRFWFQLGGWSFILLLFYFIAIQALTGEFAKRFEAIYSNAYLNRCSYDQQSLTILLKRVFRDLFALFQREGMMTAALFLPLFWVDKKVRANQETFFWVISAIALLLSSNFMSISLTSYVPMCLDARHYLFITPVCAIAAAQLLPILFHSKKVLYFSIGFILLVGSFSFYDKNDAFYDLYLPLLIVLIAFRFIPSNHIKLFSPILIALPLLIKPLNVVQYAHDVNYRQQRDLIVTKVIPAVKNSYLISNKVQIRLMRYYLGFENSDIELLTYPDFKLDTLKKGKDIYLLENSHTRSLMFYSLNDLPYYIQHPQKDNEILIESESPLIRLTKMNVFNDPNQQGKLLMSSINDFEGDYKNWNQNAIYLNKDYQSSGEYSMLVPEYSSTYQLELDSILNDSLISSYYLKAEVDFWVADQTDATLIISIENSDGSWLYKSQILNSAIKSYSNWALQKLSSSFNRNDYKKGSTLKAYVWNPQLNAIYIDDFKVEIKAIE